jgi:hypothetical protein
MMGEPRPRGAVTQFDDRSDRAREATMTEQAADNQSESSTEHVPVTQSTKDKFAEALARKKAEGQSRSAHLDGHGGVEGSTASHKATRQFRRKSG